MNFRALSFAVVLLGTWSGAAMAVPVTYELTFTPTVFGSHSGFGTLTFDAPVPAGVQSYGPGPTSAVDLFTVTIGQRTFDFTDSFTNVTFHDGNLFNVELTGFNFPFKLSASDTTYTYSLLGGVFTIGTITAQLETTAAVPEPSTWAMLILGFACVGLLSYRRRKLAAVDGRKRIICSMSRSGNVRDNAARESFFSKLKTARADVFDYIARFYNPTRRHSTIGDVSPVEFAQAGIGSTWWPSNRQQPTHPQNFQWLKISPTTAVRTPRVGDCDPE